MPQNFQEAFKTLQSFVAVHPEIEIAGNVICIPGDFRPEFYRLFNRAALEFIRGRFPEYLGQGQELSRAYLSARENATGRLGLQTVQISAGTHWFLADPEDGLVRILFDPLFDVLKGKQDPASFEADAAGRVSDSFVRFFREGYRLWVTFALLNILAADRAYEVPAPDYYDPAMADMTDLRPGTHKENVAAPVETDRIVLEQAPLCTFLVPSFVVHTTALGCYASFRENFCDARWQARSVSPSWQWLPLAGFGQGSGAPGPWPDIALYFDADLKQLNLVADYYQMACPDIMVECREETFWDVESIVRHYDTLRPALGSFVVCREIPSPDIYQTLSADGRKISVLVAGYDTDALLPVTNAAQAKCASDKAP